MEIILTKEDMEAIAAAAGAYVEAAKADPALAVLAMEEIAQAGAVAPQAAAKGDASQWCAAMTKAAVMVRRAGYYPYYLARVMGCYFAVNAPKDADLPAFIAQASGLRFEVELIREIAEACMNLWAGAPLVRDAKEVAMMKAAYEKGYYYEKAYRGCAQCTLASLSDVVGFRNDHLFRQANILAAGMGSFGDGACGGYSGGLLFLGNYAGRRIEHFDGDAEEKAMSMKLADELHTKFLNTYGTIICHGIHKDIFGRPFFLRDSEDKAAFEAAGAHKDDKCSAVVGIACAWVVEILLDNKFIEAK